MLTTCIFYSTEGGSYLQRKVYLLVAELSLRCQSVKHQKYNLDARMSEMFEMYKHCGPVQAVMWKSIELGYFFENTGFTSLFKNNPIHRNSILVGKKNYSFLST